LKKKPPFTTKDNNKSNRWFIRILAANNPTMRIDIITVLPQLLQSPLDHSIIKRAKDKELVEVHIHDLRDFSLDKHKRVDDYAFGGDAGMVMCVEPIHRTIEHLSSQREYNEIIYTSPDGKLFTQQEANRLATIENMIILCGHYKGVDQRVRDHLITSEISIGDYVMTGGELAAAVIADSVIRLLPGAISDETSALTDSFQDGMLAPPVYTRPANYKGWKVPDILLSGHAANIAAWKHKKSLERTRTLRPGLLGRE
jgi:tRNA (guanine37-N1)-methyltransferase